MEVFMTSLDSDLGGLGALTARRLPTAARMLGEAVRASCDPYVPYRTGRLASSVKLTLTAEGAELAWTAPYAAECYYASRAFNQKIHPDACAHWFEAAMAADRGLWEETVRSALSSPAERVAGVVGKDGTSAWKN